MSEDTNDNLIHETPGSTPDFKTDLARQLAELMPEVVADGKIDTVKLKELLDEDVADENERFGLFWPGKRRALRAAQEPTTATLRPDLANSKDWDTTQNVFIEGDNLEVLKILQKHYHNRIKLIYIDPPYNTGKDFVYPDNFKEGLETYLEWTRQVNEEGKRVSTNSESEGRYHSNWLNMMLPRLKLARNLLTHDGVIVVSIDENEYAHLRKLLDEVFGESNYRNTLAVRRRVKSLNIQFADQGLKTLNVGFEYAVVYSRSSDYSIPPLRVRKDNSSTKGRWDVFWSGADRPTMRYELLGFTPKTGQWRNSKDKAQVAVENYNTYLSKFAGEVTIEEYSARTGIKKFIRRIEGGTGKNGGVQHWVPPSDTALRSSNWTDLEVSEIHKEIDLPFENPKSRLLIEEILRLGDLKDGDIVLDFFAGSGTTAHAVMELNAREGYSCRFIQVQLPETTPEDSDARRAGFKTVAEIARKRISLAGDKVKSGSGVAGETLDLGFRAYTLADTNFAKWRVSSDTDRSALEQHLFNLRGSSNDDATPDDLLTEILLKQGYSLTEKITESEVAGLDVRVVGDNLVVAYLSEGTKPVLDQLRAMVDQDPQRIIILEDAFQGDDEVKTNLAQLCKSKGIELWTA